METIVISGREEAVALVTTCLMSLEWLAKDHPTAFFELSCLARNHEHRLFGNTDEILKSLFFVQPSGAMHDSIRNIVLHSIEGEGLDLRLKSKVALS